VNDTLIADFFAGKRHRKYSASWRGALSDIDSIVVQFDNDTYGDFGDRNLSVKEIVINSKIKIPYLNNSEYDVIVHEGKMRINNNSDSNAELTKQKLETLGIDSSLIEAVAGRRVRVNRTLTSALAFRDWILKTDQKIAGINIISLGPHARRTWMTYNRVLNEAYDIGIMSVSDNGKGNKGNNRILKTLRETLGIIYYWIILIPY
jgi:hypothetical protein